MPNVMAVLRNIGDALCLTPQSLADQDVKPDEICWGAPNKQTDLSHIVRPCGGDIDA